MTQELENTAVRELTADELLTVSGGWEATGAGIAFHFAGLVNYLVGQKGLPGPFTWVGSQEPER
jgi:hypothetical protein